MLQQLLAAGTDRRVQLQALVDDAQQIVAVLGRDRVIDAPRYLAVEPLDGLGAEGRLLRTELVDYAPEAPDVAFLVVGAVLPDLGRRVIGRPRLRVRHLVLLDDFGHIQVAEQDLLLVLADEYVGRLQVSVHDAEVVQVPKTLDHLVDPEPDQFFIELRLPFDALADFAHQIAPGGEVLHDAQALRDLAEERFFVPDDVRVVNAGEYPHLIDGVGLFLVAQIVHLHLLERIHLVVRFSGHAVDGAERALPKLFMDLKVAD